MFDALKSLFSPDDAPPATDSRMTTRPAAPAVQDEPPPTADAQERRAAHAARIQELDAVEESARAKARHQRAEAEAARDRELERIGKEQLAALEAERRRITELFMPRVEKAQLLETVSRTLNAESERLRSAAKAACDQRVAACTAEQDHALAASARHRAEAEEAAARTERAISEKLLAEFYADVTAKLETWLDVPSKPHAEAVGRVYWNFDLRAKAELGSALWRFVIVIAMSDVLFRENPVAISKLGADFDGLSNLMQAAHGFVVSLEESGLEITKALMSLKQAIETVAASGGQPDERLAARYRAKHHWATAAAETSGIKAQHEQDRVRAAAAARNAKHPKRVSYTSRDYCIIEYADGSSEKVFDSGHRVPIRFDTLGQAVELPS